MAKRVLMVGWHPSVVDYAKYPGLDADKLLAALNADKTKLTGMGYDTEIAFIHSGETATSQVEDTLRDTAYDAVLIGAGVRKDDDHFLVFETLVNVVHANAPKAKIVFNTGPHDSDAAVLRWLA